MMNSVTVQRDNLLGIVRENMEAHRELFLKAQKGYRSAVIEELDKMLEEARSGKPIRRMIQLSEPVDRTEDYARVVAMLEMSIDEDITLRADDFDRYVRDRWEWSELASTVNTAYANR